MIWLAKYGSFDLSDFMVLFFGGDACNIFFYPLFFFCLSSVEVIGLGLCSYWYLNATSFVPEFCRCDAHFCQFYLPFPLYFLKDVP